MFPATSLPQEERRVTGVRRLRHRREVRIVFATDNHGLTRKRVLVRVRLCKSVAEIGGTERTRTVIDLIDNQVPHLSATVPVRDWQRVSDSNRRSPD